MIEFSYKYTKMVIIMTKKITEIELLNELDIPDWRHMTKDKVITFASRMPYIDPEVAKKALEQFPNFVKLGNELVVALKDITNSSYEESSKSMIHAYEANMKILESLDARLNKPFIFPKEREMIINAMLEISDRIYKMENEHHHFLYKGIGTVGKVAAGAILIAGAAVGVVIKK